MATSLAPVRKLSDIKFVTIHHSAEEPAALNLKELKAKAIKWDKHHATKDYDGNGTSDAQYTDGKFGYKYLLYHYLVARDGSILQAQDIKYQRFHATDSARGKTSHNLYGIAIVVDGNYSQFKIKKVQIEAVAQLIHKLEKQLKKSLIVRTHKEQAVQVIGNKVNYPEKTGRFYTECPGITIGTSKDGACKQIIKRANELMALSKDNSGTKPTTPSKPPTTPVVDPKDLLLLEKEEKIQQLQANLQIEIGKGEVYIQQIKDLDKSSKEKTQKIVELSKENHDLKLKFEKYLPFEIIVDFLIGLTSAIKKSVGIK